MDNQRNDLVASSQNIQPQLIQLDGLLGHLSCCSGLYSKETFLSLFSCITRMVRDHRMKGVILTRTLRDESFETMALALEGMPGVTCYCFNEPGSIPATSGITEATGFLIAMTDRFCAALYWSADTHETFRMYEGGWTFTPGDVKTIATHLASHIGQPELQTVLEETPIDRRYDDKLNSLTTALVNGLESRNRELIQALEQVSGLNQKVVQSERLAAVGQLCSVIAHEIRNPLGLIDLYAKLIEGQLEKVLENTTIADAQQETLLKNLSQIRQATGSLETILSELTNYSRPLELQLESVDVVTLVLDVCEFYSPSYSEKEVKLVLPDSDQDPILLNLDTGRIRQALINLLKNALEASSADTQVKVVVASRKGDRSVYIKVADQGSGVDPKVAGKLFTPYFSTKGNGTGLGLAHSRKILQAHGGNVELLSSSPEGSTFALILPKTP